MTNLIAPFAICKSTSVDLKPKLDLNKMVYGASGTIVVVVEPDNEVKI